MAHSKEDKNYNNDNLETFSIWWLDAEVHNKENQETQTRLRSIINYLKTWQCPNKFVECVQRMSYDDRVVIIVSGRLGSEVVPRIHLLQQVSSIYVFCMNKKANEQWAREYIKVKGVFVRLDDLISQVQSDHKYIIRSDEPLTFTVFKVNGNNGAKTLLSINGEFLNFQLLIEILVRMKFNQTDREEFMKMCKEKYTDNIEYLKIAKEFYTTYTPENALLWYTKDTFIYKILNKAFRTQNIEVLVHLHWFINDICQQLNRNQYAKRIQVYRGQRMSTSELSSYEKLIGQFISTHTFFSTSIDKYQAISFATSFDKRHPAKSSNNHGFKPVLFEINANPRMVTNNNRPFADVSSISQFANEREVLFMVGSIFRLDGIHLDCEQHNGEVMTTIRMTLCGDEQHDLHELYNCMRKDYGNNETDLRSLGTLLAKMGKFELAQKYYHKMLGQVSSKDPVLSDLYHSLGCVAADTGDNDKSLDWYRKSLEIKMKTRSSDYVSICQTYNNMGIVLQKKGDSTQALDYYNRAVSLFQQAHDKNHIYMSALYHSIGVIYQAEKNYSQALSFYEMSVAVKQKHLPPNHPDYAISYNSIGRIHHCLGYHDIALQYYNRALEINCKTLPPMHTDIAMNQTNIGLLHGDKGEFELALNYLKSAKKIYSHSLSSHSPEIVNVKKAIKFISDKLTKK